LYVLEFSNILLTSINNEDIQMKSIIAIAAIVASAQSFAFIDDASTAANHNGSVESKSTANATGRGVATFGMNFSASANTTGDFKGDGMMQDIFGGNTESRPYYYNVK
jgi:hypothetical protein